MPEALETLAEFEATGQPMSKRVLHTLFHAYARANDQEGALNTFYEFARKHSMLLPRQLCTDIARMCQQ